MIQARSCGNFSSLKQRDGEGFCITGLTRRFFFLPVWLRHCLLSGESETSVVKDPCMPTQTTNPFNEHSSLLHVGVPKPVVWKSHCALCAYYGAVLSACATGSNHITRSPSAAVQPLIFMAAIEGRCGLEAEEHCVTLRALVCDDHQRILCLQINDH